MHSFNGNKCKRFEHCTLESLLLLLLLLLMLLLLLLLLLLQVITS